MTLRIGDEAPDFTADSTQGTIYFHEWSTSQWAIVFHVCGLNQILNLVNHPDIKNWQAEFDKRNTRCLGLSHFSLNQLQEWKDNLEIHHGVITSFPIVSDRNQNITKCYAMSSEPQISSSIDDYHYSDNYKLYIISPDKSIKLMMNYPDENNMTFYEMLQLLDSIQSSHQKPEGPIIAGATTQSFFRTTTIS